MKILSKIIIGLIVVVIVAFMSGLIYVVDETKQVVITQFGKPIGKPVISAGLHFKKPFIQQAHYFEKRLLEWDGDPNQIPTKDKKYIWVDTTARWKISDALKFLQSVTNEMGAHARLDDIINSATRDAITRTSKSRPGENRKSYPGKSPKAGPPIRHRVGGCPHKTYQLCNGGKKKGLRTNDCRKKTRCRKIPLGRTG